LLVLIDYFIFIFLLPKSDVVGAIILSEPLPSVWQCTIFKLRSCP